MSRSLRTAALAASAGAAILALAACTPTGDSTTSPKPTTSSSSSSAPGDSGSPTAAASPGSIPFSIDCDKLVSPQIVYDFNPNFVLANGAEPPAGSNAARAVADEGVACAWQNTTSNLMIYVSVARYAPAQIDALKQKSGTPSTAFSADSGYYDGTTATALQGDAWIVATSDAFSEPTDAKPFIDAAAAAVG
ncbi:arginyl-tRNA synthetase [Schumannella soli]|uniref:Arginyl-tRNA synthetase n=1 Tax=Schumannella soli TaxID=2590779 RepID=A0A506XTC2_9MICO|nr:arginyl-tRNA synthetase [Schumannella soli]TPW75961.1 arginyl-tRNA synthetase [Schumannella soli]